MRSSRFLVMLVLVCFLSGCGLVASGDRARLIHLVEADSIRSVHPEGIYNSADFDEAGNIHAERLVASKGHSVSLAQIRDREQLHVHDEHDLIVQLRSGAGELRTPNQSVELEPGDWTIIPRGKPHQFVTTSEEPARAVVIRTPPVTGDRRTVD